ncbi:MAG: hypothetical protein QNL16_13985 [Rhodobacterales bacterium]|jgi:hypothetical protein|nr:hypothetical protein [Pseudomonadota bacterium]MDA1284888.1 hypothetical protein [Pseudomonadota bacterium]
MATHTVYFYDIDPFGLFGTTPGNVSTYTGSTTAAGTAVITDNAAGINGLSLAERRRNCCLAKTKFWLPPNI